MRVEGGDQLARRLQMIALETSKAHMRESVLEGAKEIHNQAVANAQAIAKTGTLAKSVKTEIRKQTKARVEVRIGPDETGWYGRLVEDGHRTGHLLGYYRRRPGGRRYRLMRWKEKMVAPKPWLRPAFDSKHKKAQDRIAAELKRRIGL